MRYTNNKSRMGIRYVLFRFAAGVFTGIFAVMFFTSVSVGQTVTTGTLIKDMVDLDRLADYPEKNYKMIQYSSYDRRSDQPNGPGWFSNNDGFGGEPIPNFEAVLEEPGEDNVGTYLLCDVEGPGAIVRGWTAYIRGTVRVYLDGSDSPIYEGPMPRFLQKTYMPFLEQLNDSNLSADLLEGTFFQRQAGYFPIPFEENLRIEWTGNIDKIHFYHLQIRKYEEETDVETFTPQDLVTYEDEIKEAAQILSNPDKGYSYPEGSAVSAAVGADETGELFAHKGEGAIKRLKLKVDAVEMDKALRQTILNISFDGSPKGQVQMPLGDFFGAAPGINPYVSVPFTVRDDGTMIARFVMPYKESVSIKVQNKGNQHVKVHGSVVQTDYDWKTDRSMHFHAKWRIDHNMNRYTPYDLPFANIRGKGIFVGAASILKNPIEIPTTGGNWWGEGDEKIFVDNEEHPSIYGTGSEDYYNYAWSSSDLFDTPYAAQPRNDGPGTRGFVTNNRWHVVDPIPFQHNLSFNMEFFQHTQNPNFSYARSSYYYARPGAIDDHMPISDEDVRHLELAKWSPKADGRASGAKFYQIESLVKDTEQIKLLEHNLWADGQLLVWNPREKGETLSIPFEVAESGEYRLWMTVAKMKVSGKVSISVDDADVGFGGENGILNLKGGFLNVLRNYTSKKLSLEKGSHTMTVRYEGDQNDAEIGLDFLWVQKQ